MKILVLYFSGTGNTKFIAKKFENRLSKKDYFVDCVSVENMSPEKVEIYDLLIFGFPVYGYDMPVFLKEYVGNITIPSSKGVILFSTIGYNGGNSLTRAAKLFQDKGFLVIGSREFLMPGNDGLIISKKNSKNARRVLDKDYGNSKAIESSVKGIVKKIDELSNGNIEEKDVRLPKKRILYCIITPIMRFVFFLFEKIFTKKFRADESCIDCGLCEEICPADNISIENGEVKFKDNCYFCLRCINQCPAEAIQITRYTKGKFRFKGPMGSYVPDPLDTEQITKLSDEISEFRK